MAEILRPRSLGELFSQTFSLVFNNLPPLIAIQAIFWLPVSLLNYLVAAAMKDVSVQVDPSGSVVLDQQVMVGGTNLVFGFVAGLIINPIISASSMLVISDCFMGRKTSLGSAIGIALRRLWTLIMVGLVVTLCAGACLGVGVGALAASSVVGGLGAIIGLPLALVCITLFFWVQTTFSVAAPAVALESLGTGAALQRSRHLTTGFRMRILLLMVAIGLILFAMGIAVGISTAPALGEDQEMAKWAVDTVVSMVSSMIVCVAIVALYFDLRVRKDGFDLDNLAELVDVIAHRAAIPPDPGAATEPPDRDLQHPEGDDQDGTDT